MASTTTPFDLSQARLLRAALDSGRARLVHPAEADVRRIIRDYLDDQPGPVTLAPIMITVANRYAGEGRRALVRGGWFALVGRVVQAMVDAGQVIEVRRPGGACVLYRSPRPRQDVAQGDSLEVRCPVCGGAGELIHGVRQDGQGREVIEAEDCWECEGAGGRALSAEDVENLWRRATEAEDRVRWLEEDAARARDALVGGRPQEARQVLMALLPDSAADLAELPF